MPAYKEKEPGEFQKEAVEKASETRQDEVVARAFGQATEPARRRELQLEHVEGGIADAQKELGSLGRLANEVAEDLGLPELVHKFWRVGAEFTVIREKVGMRRELGNLVAEREERARAEAGEAPRTKAERFRDKVSGLKKRMGERVKAVPSALKGTVRDIRKNPQDYRPIPYLVKTVKGVRDTIKSTQESRRAFKEVMGAMTPGYVGERTHERVSKDPIVMVRANEKYFDLRAEVKRERKLREEGATEARGSAGRIRGLSRNKTNNIVINKEIEGADERIKTVSHEAHHAVSWRGGSHLVSAGKEKPRYILWLHEGLTELHAQQQVRSLGYEPKSVSYKPETAVSLFMQKIAGADELRKAYFSGHFDTVAARVDAALGKGAFGEIISAEKGRDALAIINGRINPSADYASLNRDELLVKTGFRFG